MLSWELTGCGVYPIRKILILEKLINSLPDGDANEVDPTEDVVPSVHHAGVRQHGVLQHPYHILGESTA